MAGLGAQFGANAGDVGRILGAAVINGIEAIIGHASTTENSALHSVAYAWIDIVANNIANSGALSIHNAALAVQSQIESGGLTTIQSLLTGIATVNAVESNAANYSVETDLAGHLSQMWISLILPANASVTDVAQAAHTAAAWYQQAWTTAWTNFPLSHIIGGEIVGNATAAQGYMGASLQLARSVVAAWNSQPSWGRVAPLLRVAPDVAGSKRDPGVLTGNIDVTNVYFRYGPDAPFALQGVSLSLAPGEHVALVGPSGSGKSTLMRLLLGFEMPASGTVQYDRQDLRYLDIEMVRRQIGGVLQNTALFPGTLYENIMSFHRA